MGKLPVKSQMEEGKDKPKKTDKKKLSPVMQIMKAAAKAAQNPKKKRGEKHRKSVTAEESLSGKKDLKAIESDRKQKMEEDMS